MGEYQPIRKGQILNGALFNEPMRVETIRENGPEMWVLGLVGTQSERFRSVNHPLPHQLEAVYDYLLKLARVRFLLADDAGAGKTIMVGLLIRELKLRGLATHVELSLTELLQRADEEIGKLASEIERKVQGAEGRLAQAEDRRDCYWLYIVTNCKGQAKLQNPIKDPTCLEWHEVKKVDHYWLKIDALTQPLQIKEDSALYGDREKW